MPPAPAYTQQAPLVGYLQTAPPAGWPPAAPVTVSKVSKGKKILIAAVAVVLVAGVAGAIVWFTRPQLANCMLGTWREDSNTTVITRDGKETDRMTDKGATQVFRSDGTTTQTYPDNSVRVDYKYTVSGSKVSYIYDPPTATNPDAAIVETVTCEGDHMTQHGQAGGDTAGENRTWDVTLTRKGDATA